MTATIPLWNRAGEVVAESLVDAEDYDAVAAHHWCWSAYGYAVRTIRVPGDRQRAVYLHRHLLDLGHGNRLQGDHINGVRLDNRRENLRVVDASGQAQNRHGSQRTDGRTSMHRGVCWDKAKCRWHARSTLHGHTYNLGHFVDEQEAAAVASAFRAVHMPTSDMDRVPA